MTFHSPHLLWLLVPLLLLFSWEMARHTARAAHRWPKITRAWAGAFDVSLGERHTTAETRPRLWLWLGLTLCTIALARPQWGVTEEQVFDQSREVLIALDLSKSMLAQDVKPSRLERSKLLISSLLDGLKGERVGLVLFSGTAFLQSPLSADYGILRELLPALNPGYLPEGGTNYRAMLETAIDAFGTSSADRYLIVLSDGEATDDNWRPLIETLKTKGIRVIGLGVGTSQGAFIPDGEGGLVKDERGAVVLSRLDSSTLRELAQVTGGAYADASSWVDLPALLRQTVEAGRKGEFTERNTARFVERFQWFLAPGLLLLLISFWSEFPVRPRERAIPLGRRRAPQPATARRPAVAASLAGALAFFALAGARTPADENPREAFAAPLVETVNRLTQKDALSARDCADLAQTTITYGQRMNSAQLDVPDGVIGDALAGVDRGEQIDAHAADWPRLRRQLEDLRRQQQQRKQEQQKQDQQKQQQQKQSAQNQQQNGPQQQNQSNPSQGQQGQNQPEPNQTANRSPSQNPSSSTPPESQPPSQNEKAFGNMRNQKSKAGRTKPQPAASSAMQKVGGQKEDQSELASDPELAVPLQTLEQVKNQDEPAVLQQILQGKPEKTVTNGKDW